MLVALLSRVWHRLKQVTESRALCAIAFVLGVSLFSTTPSSAAPFELPVLTRLMWLLCRTAASKLWTRAWLLKFADMRLSLTIPWFDRLVLDVVTCMPLACLCCVVCLWCTVLSVCMWFLPCACWVPTFRWTYILLRVSSPLKCVRLRVLVRVCLLCCCRQPLQLFGYEASWLCLILMTCAVSVCRKCWLRAMKIMSFLKVSSRVLSVLTVVRLRRPAGLLSNSMLGPFSTVCVSSMWCPTLLDRFLKGALGLRFSGLSVCLTCRDSF